MVNEELRSKISEQGFSDSIVYDCPSFDESILGITEDGRTVYDYDMMVEEYVKDNNENFVSLNEDELSEAIMEAEDFISYNTIRATPYMGILAPIILGFNPETDELYNMCSSEEEKFEENFAIKFKEKINIYE